MPFDIKPILGGGSDTSSYDQPLGGNWSELAKQDFSYQRSFAATSLHHHGGLLGGPTLAQMYQELDPKQYTILAHPLPLTAAVLQGYNNSLGGKKIGQLDLNLIDPFGTLAEATGSFIGNDKQQPGTGFADRAATFLAGKNIDLFGQEDTGVPARLADYALALPIALLNKMNGVHSTEPTANPSGVQYAFQQDPGYWALLGQAKSDDQLRVIATAVAARQMDPSRNQYLVNQLVDQMKHDRDQVLTGMTSGNSRIDEMAKWRFASDLAGQGDQPLPSNGPINLRAMQYRQSAATGTRAIGLAGDIVSSIPFVGAQIAAGLVPINGNVEKRWQQLTPDQRQNYYSNAGLATAGLDFVASLPMLGGMGQVLAFAKGAEGIAGTLYHAYDTTLRAAAATMGFGLTVAVSNWALEAAVPAWSDIAGKEIDYARPISKSSLAGIVNELGFWSSGTFGVYPAIQTPLRVLNVVGAGIGKVERAAGVSGLGFGVHELGFFRDVMGGSGVRSELDNAGIHGIDTSVKTWFLSNVLNHLESVRLDATEAIVRGVPSAWPRINALDPEARLAWANEQLARGMYGAAEAAEYVVRTIAYGRTPRPINPSQIIREQWDAAQKFGRTFVEDMSARAIGQYGPEWIASKRMVGSYTAKDMEAWARAKVTELGGDGTKLGSHDEDGWAKIIRTLHQKEFHDNAAELVYAAEGTAEEGKVAIVDATHLFRDRHDAGMKILDQSESGFNEAEAHDWIATTIRTTPEAAAWFTDEWHPKAGVAKRPENVPVEVFRAWLEDVGPALPTRRINADPASDTFMQELNQLQAKLDKQGTWALAFKPVDDAGNFVSYARTRSGGLLRSPWVEYPLTAPDNLELGNRGLLASKMDGLTRAFRTRQITEFQRGNLFRMLTAKVDVLPEQIDALNAGVLEISRDLRVPPQTVGTLGRLPVDMPFAGHSKDLVEKLATDIFGPGDLIGRDGRPVKIDWAATVAKAYRQSFKLNATAGLTSYLKSMGGVGAAVSVGSDIIYVIWRFGLSPLFKTGEVVESGMLNAMRGVWRSDPELKKLFMYGGFGNDGTFLTSELAFDAMTQSITARGGEFSPDQRAAASMSLYARHTPEDLQMSRTIASTQSATEAWLADHNTTGPIPSFAHLDTNVEPSGPALYDPNHPVGHSVPLDFSADPIDHAFDYVDPSLSPEDRGMWHTTTNLPAVLRNGLKARRQLITQLTGEKPEHLIVVGDKVVVGGGDIATVTSPPVKGKPTRKQYQERKAARADWDKIKAEFDVAANNPNVSKMSVDAITRRMRDVQIRLVNAEKAVENAGRWEFTATWPGQSPYPRTLFYVDNVHSIEDAATGEVKWQPEAGGLGGAGMTHVSVTTSEEHANLIAMRLDLAAKASRMQATPDEIVQHFLDTSTVYDQGSTEEDLGQIANAIEREWPQARGFSIHSQADFVNSLNRLMIDGRDRYTLVQLLDSYAMRHPADDEIGGVGLIAGWEAMRTINPDSIGTVRIAARNGVKPAIGPDANELQFDSGDVFTIDDRPVLPPISDNQDELLRQLREVLANEPHQILVGSLAEDIQKVVGENGVKPGLEGRAQEILRRLVEQRRQLGDGGPVYRFEDLTPRQQEEAIRNMVANGDLQLPTGFDLENMVVTYHGTPSTAFEAFDPNFIATRPSLYGPGVYITEAHDVAKEYSEIMSVIDPSVAPSVPGGNILRVMVRKDLNLLNLDERLPGKVRVPIRNWVKKMQVTWDAERDRLLADPHHDIQDLLDAQQQLQRISHTLNDLNNPRLSAGDIYHSLDALGDRQSLFGGQSAEVAWQQVVTGFFSRHGYDGFTHEGGRIMGDRLHTVRIIWDTQNAQITPMERLNEAFAQAQRRPAETVDMADVAGTPEAVFEHAMPVWAEQVAKNGPTAAIRHAAATIAQPANFKQGKALDLQIRLFEKAFPGLLRASGNDGLIKVFESLGIREDHWARFLLKDRELVNQWLEVKGDPVKAPVALQKLFDHAGGEKNQAEWNALYSSPEWDTLTALWAIHLGSARDEAFGVHFFTPYRTAIERSINHPVLGIYPASWALKAAREWTRFLFDNRMFGDLRLGMAPAQAIAELARNQSAGFAMTNDDTLAHFMQKGPLGSTIFIFNLLLPGDWSSLPFPLSRTIREVLRGDTDPTKVFEANANYLGATRDARLVGESLGEFHDLIFGANEKDTPNLIKGVSVRGVDDQFSYDYH